MARYKCCKFCFEEEIVWSILGRGRINTLAEEALFKSRLELNKNSPGYFSYYIEHTIEDLLYDFTQRRLIRYGKV